MGDRGGREGSLMLQLNAEQVQRLQTIQLQRDVRSLGAALGARFPDVPPRLADRYLALVAHAVQRGAAQGLTHAACVARYLACWFMLGAEFESRPGFEWARRLLADAHRDQGAKAFQLCRRVREALPPSMPAATFDAAIAALDTELIDFGAVGSLQRGGRVALGAACDIDAVDLRLVAPAAARPYAVEHGQWRRADAAPAPPPLQLRAGDGVLPAQLSVLGHAAGSAPARLRLRTLSAQCCDPQLHPLVTLNGSQGPHDWRGAQAADVTLDLYAEAPAAAPLLIGAESAPQLSLLTLASCGLRDGGDALGELTTRVAVHPAEQHLLAWRREPPGEWSWPEPPSGQPAGPAPHCRVERDGQPLDASRWQAGLAQLDQQLAQSLARLATAWDRTSGVTRGRLVAEPQLLCGDAGVAWGWAAGAALDAPAWWRIAGHMDLVACRLNLRFSGDLALHGAGGRVSLQSHASEPLRTSWQRGPDDAELLPTRPLPLAAFRQPFVFHIDTLAQAELALVDAAPATGAVVGSCGLRPRADGAGLQWFAQLAIEPVAVTLHWSDPLLGRQDLARPLLPAFKLLDWSLG